MRNALILGLAVVCAALVLSGPVDAQKSKIVEVTRTIANYENYLRDLRKTLYDAYYRRTLDVLVAERLTQAAFDRFKLPKILGD